MKQLLLLNDLIINVKHALPFLPEKIEVEKLYALRSLQSRSEMNLKRIAVAGSFSSGKSTFINSILKLTGDRAQATGISETTAVPTVIRPSGSTSFMRWDHGVLEKAPPAFEAAMLKLRADSMSDLLEHYFSSEMEFVREVELDEVFHGIEYLDLPGLLGIAGKRYDQAIRAGILGSDGLVYVVNGRHGFQESDRQFAEREVPEEMPVLVLVTHLGEGSGKKSAEDDVQVLAKIRESAGAAFKERLRGVCATRYDNAKDLHEWDILEQRRLFKFQTDIEPMLLYGRCNETAYSIVQKICATEEIPQEIRSRMKGVKESGYFLQEECEQWLPLAAGDSVQEVVNLHAMCCDSANGVSMDVKELMQRFLLTAEQGHPLGQNNLGWCYLQGRGVAKDEKEAVRWFRLSAEQGHPMGQFNLGWCYLHGQGVAKDESKAVKWFSPAAEQGSNAKAQCNLGYCYLYGKGVAEDAREAVRWLRPAAEQGKNPKAQHNLGLCYFYGMGIAIDEKEAVKWFERSAIQGNNTKAECYLAVCYAMGRGVLVNEQMAIDWLCKAAEHGNERAKNELARCYKNGTGFPKDKKRTIRWYRLAEYLRYGQ